MITLAFHLKRGHLADREARAGLRIGVHLAFVEELQKLISESGLAVTDHSEESVWVLHAKNSRGKADLFWCLHAISGLVGFGSVRGLAA